MDADKDDWHALEYNAGSESTKGNSVISLNGLEKNVIIAMICVTSVTGTVAIIKYRRNNF